MKETTTPYTFDVIARLRSWGRRRQTPVIMPTVLDQLATLRAFHFTHIYHTAVSVFSVTVPVSPIAAYCLRLDAAAYALEAQRLTCRILPADAWHTVTLPTFFLAPDSCYSDPVVEADRFITSASWFVQTYLAASARATDASDQSGVVLAFTAEFQTITHVIDVLTRAQTLLD